MGQSIAKDICVYGGMCLPLVVADAVNKGTIYIGQKFMPEQVNYAAAAVCAASALIFFGSLVSEEVSEALKEYNINVPNLWDRYNNQ